MAGDDPAAALDELEPLVPEERRELLRIARSAVGDALGLEPFTPVALPSPALLGAGAAFVSIYAGGRLRGCVGTTRRDDPLHVAVARVARSAAIADPRFPALAAEEWAVVSIEISRLGELRAVSPEAIEPGRHGLCVGLGERQGLLLPQVAERFGWSRERFLEETCLKAGLARDAWRDPSAHVLAFRAEIFGDADEVPG